MTICKEKEYQKRVSDTLFLVLKTVENFHYLVGVERNEFSFFLIFVVAESVHLQVGVTAVFVVVEIYPETSTVVTFLDGH